MGKQIMVLLIFIMILAASLSPAYAMEKQEEEWEGLKVCVKSLDGQIYNMPHEVGETWNMLQDRTKEKFGSLRWRGELVLGGFSLNNRIGLQTSPLSMKLGCYTPPAHYKIEPGDLTSESILF
jgi:hypothetical protein